jgi:hypothetical protein
MERELASLSFPQAVFRVAVIEPDGPGLDGSSSTGRDTVEFLFSANPGEPVKPLVKIVSGGELSRLMLAMKCLLARRDQVDTVIFDEIDAGIGGQAAEAVAGKISELAGHHQVVCITHSAADCRLLRSPFQGGKKGGKRTHSDRDQSAPAGRAGGRTGTDAGRRSSDGSDLGLCR